MCVFWKPNEGGALRKREPLTASNASDVKKWGYNLYGEFC